MLDHYSAFTTFAKGYKNQLISKISIEADNKSCSVNAIWDTGATNSCISEEVVKNLGLIPTGMCAIKTPSSTMDTSTYLVDIQLPNNVLIRDVEVMESKIGEQGLGALLGMNIIRLGDFAVSNYKGDTVFSFVIPSLQTINFIPKVKTLNQAQQGHRKKSGKKKKK